LIFIATIIFGASPLEGNYVKVGKLRNVSAKNTTKIGNDLKRVGVPNGITEP